MPSKKKGNSKKKSTGEQKKGNCTATSVIGIESKERFILRISEYKNRNHGMIISPKPSIVAMQVASEAGRKMKKAASSASGTTTKSTTTNKCTEFLRHCGKRVEEIAEYDIKTNMVNVRLLLKGDHNDSNATTESSSLMVKVPSQALIEELSSFPYQNETTKETLNRLLQYKFTSQRDQNLLQLCRTQEVIQTLNQNWQSVLRFIERTMQHKNSI